MGLGIPIGPITYESAAKTTGSISTNVANLVSVIANTTAKVLQSKGQTYYVGQEQVGIPEEIYVVKKRYELFHKEMSLGSALIIGGILSLTIAIVVAQQSKRKRKKGD